MKMISKRRPDLKSALVGRSQGHSAAGTELVALLDHGSDFQAVVARCHPRNLACLWLHPRSWARSDGATTEAALLASAAACVVVVATARREETSRKVGYPSRAAETEAARSAAAAVGAVAAGIAETVEGIMQSPEEDFAQRTAVLVAAAGTAATSAGPRPRQQVEALALPAALAVMYCAARREVLLRVSPFQQPRRRQTAFGWPLHFAVRASLERSQTTRRLPPLPTTLATQRSRGAHGFLPPAAAARPGQRQRRKLAPCRVVRARPRLRAVAKWSPASTLSAAEALRPGRRSARLHLKAGPNLRHLTPLSFRRGMGSAAGHWLLAELSPRVSRPSAGGKAQPWVGLAVDATAPLATARLAATLASSIEKNRRPIR